MITIEEAHKFLDPAIAGNTIFGTIAIGSGLGSALGAWAGGLIHDWTHSYNPVMAFALVAVVLGLIPFLVVPALRR